MKILILPEFIEDLKSLDNIKTLARTLEKLFDNRFNFKQNRDDHRYDGIDNAWIRDISKGSTAYRTIFINKGNTIYLYRTGTKKIEQNLPDPNLAGSVFELSDFKVEITGTINEFHDNGKLLKSPRPTELFDEIIRFNHVPLREIWMISPKVSFDLFSDNHHLGKFINKAAESDTMIILITLPPQNQEQIVFYDSLEIKNIIVAYNEKVHAKMWYFDIDFENLGKYLVEDGFTSTAILGSANLTFEGLGQNNTVEENTIELCYKLPAGNIEEFYKICNDILDTSIGHSEYKNNKRWQ